MARQTGTTTQQMTAAPLNSIYVWTNSILVYPNQLALKINRKDLQIVSPSWLTSYRWKGREVTGIVIDHATELNDKQWECYHNALSCVRLEKEK
jgi:hypothetical protein